jgi:demethylmenaquinone methyltransferase/2-methoxy-6-polyprenyl-1,4-benzoquinol methylase
MERNLFETEFAIYYEKIVNRISSIFFVNRWRKLMIKESLKVSKDNKIVVDFCSGVGNVGKELIKFSKPKLLINCDLSMTLLKIGKRKLKGKGIYFVRADNRFFPIKKNSLDILFTSFCVRHSPEPEKTVEEAFKTLKRKGVWGNIEFFRPESKPITYRLSELMFKSFINFNRLIVPKYSEEFKSFFKSIEEFYTISEFNNLLESKGFNLIKVKSLMNGIAYVTIAVKP